MTKKKKKVNRQGPGKKVTLPIAAKMIYESLAKIAWRVEKDKHRDASKESPPISEEGFKHYILQELGKDAFLYSFLIKHRRSYDFFSKDLLDIDMIFELTLVGVSHP